MTNFLVQHCSTGPQGPSDQGNDSMEIFRTDDGSVPERIHVNQHKKGDGET